MTNEELLKYWDSIPCDDQPIINCFKNENYGCVIYSVSYEDLGDLWNIPSRRQIRAILAELSAFDSGDDYILIRTSHDGGGFYKTRDHAKIEAYRKEVYNRAMNTLKPLKKIKRVLNRNEQITIDDLLMFGIND